MGIKFITCFPQACLWGLKSLCWRLKNKKKAHGLVLILSTLFPKVSVKTTEEGSHVGGRAKRAQWFILQHIVMLTQPLSAPQWLWAVWGQSVFLTPAPQCSAPRLGQLQPQGTKWTHMWVLTMFDDQIWRNVAATNGILSNFQQCSFNQAEKRCTSKCNTGVNCWIKQIYDSSAKVKVYKVF